MSAETDTLHQPFFFVNKTSKSASLSHGKADEAFYIQSYVQSRVRKQKRRAKQTYRVSVSPQLAAVKLSPPSYSNSVICDDNASPDAHAGVFSQTSPTVKPRRKVYGTSRKSSSTKTTSTATGSPNRTTPTRSSPSSTSSSNDSPLSQHAAVSAQLKQTSKRSLDYSHGYSATLYFGEPSYLPSAPVMDSLAASNIALDEKTYKLLQYPLSSFIVTHFAAESLSLLLRPVTKGPFRHNDAVIRKLRRCSEDDMLMYAALANSASCIRWAVGEELDGALPEHFMLKTISRLKLRLSEDQKVCSGILDEWCIMCVHDMSVADLWSEDLEAAAAHMRMIAHTLNEFGGLVTLEPYLLENLLLADKYLALRRGCAPILPFPWILLANAPPPSAAVSPSAVMQESGDDDEHVRLSRMGIAFFGMTPNTLPTSSDSDFTGTTDLLDESMLWLLQDTITCIKEVHGLASILDPHTEHFLFLRHQSLAYRLLLLQTHDVLNEVMRLGLLMWLLKIASSLQAERAAKNLLPRLKVALEDLATNEDVTMACLNDYQQEIHSAGGNQQTNHVLAMALWATTVGARVAEFMDEREWFVHHAAGLGRRIGLAPDKEAYARFLRDFFYLECEEGLQFKRMVLVIRQCSTSLNTDITSETG